MGLAEKVLPVAVPVAVCVGVIGVGLISLYKPKSALTVLHDKTYCTDDVTIAYSPARPTSDPIEVQVTDNKYVVAPRRLENGKTGVSITPLCMGLRDSHWFELLDLDGDHATVEKKIVRQAFYRQIRIPVVTPSDVYFTPVRMDIAPIPTAEDHDLMQRLTKRTNIQ